MFKSTSWKMIPRDDLIVNGFHPLTTTEEKNIDENETSSLEIRRPLDFLYDDIQIVITPSNQMLNMQQIYLQITKNVVPIFIYIIDQETLSENDIDELRFFQNIVPNEPILFIRIDQLES